MLEPMWRLLMLGIQKVKEVRYALAFAAIAAAVAIAASFLHGYMSNVGGVVVAVNMGVMLIIAVLMTVAAAKAKGEQGKPYARLYVVLAWVFSFILIASAILSLTSVFFNHPIDFRTSSAIEPTYSGDYRIQETVMLMDLRHRIPTKDTPGALSKDPKYRIDRVVRQRQTTVPYEMQWGTNGDRIEDFVSSTHPGMTTKEESSARFSLTTKHTYVNLIPADQIPFNYPTDVMVQATFVNAFAGEQEEWVGACPNVDTELLTMIVLCPQNKVCRSARAMEQPTGSAEIPFRGFSVPVIHDGGKLITWSIMRPSKGVGYFIAFTW
jgi:hypothetical protein